MDDLNWQRLHSSIVGSACLTGSIQGAGSLRDPAVLKYGNLGPLVVVMLPYLSGYLGLIRLSISCKGQDQVCIEPSSIYPRGL